MTRNLRALSVGVVAIATVLTMSACGSSSEATSAPAEMPTGGQQRSFPGADGLIASVAGATLQVQGTDAQTAVTYAGSTAITKTTTVALDSVKSGDCVTATGTEEGGVLTASSLRVSAPVDGSCSASGPDGMGRGQGGPPGGGTPPSGIPGGGERPSGAPDMAGMNFAIGTVTGVTANGLSVNGRIMSPSAGQPSSAPADTAISIATAATTTITKDVKSSASALVVGQGARALGTADEKGTIAATSINVSAPVDGSCGMRLGAPR